MGNPQNLINNLLFYIMIVVCVVEWIAAELKKRKLRYFTKPLSILLIIAWFSLVGRWQGQLVWFGLALAFSFVGDVLLLFPDKLFIFGMLAFLIAHVMYILGFTIGQSMPIQKETLYILLAVGVAAAVVLSYVLKGLHEKPGHRKMLIPVIAYSIAIGLMLISALLNLIRPEWRVEGIAGLPAAIFTAVGAAFFFVSDAMLASRNFVRRFTHDDFMIMSTYHIGQIVLAAGALMHFLK